MADMTTHVPALFTERPIVGVGENYNSKKGGMGERPLLETPYVALPPEAMTQE